MLVSVLSLVYNHEPYLEDFFRGLLEQEHPYEWEIVIGVDQCTDHSLDICKKYRDQYPALIRLIVHEERTGIIPNFIATYEACTGKYIAMCEGDDYWTDSQKIIKQVKVFEGDSGTVLCFTDIDVLDDETGKFYPNWAEINKSSYSITDIITLNTITTCSVMFRNGHAKLDSQSFKDLQMADWPLYIELLTHGDARYLGDKTAVYRRNEASSFAKNPVVEQLQKKICAVEYLQQLPQLQGHSSLLKKVWNELTYSVAVRLPKKSKLRNHYLQQVMYRSCLSNPVLLIKALVHRL